MANRKKKEEGSISTNAWMATYCDLMILLLTFFVLLLSLATIDKKRKRLALNSFVGAFGFKPGAQSVIGNPKGLNITVGSAPMVKENIQFERLRNVALKHGLKSELSMSKQIERTVLSISNKVLFAPGEYSISTESSDFLLELANIIKDGPKLIEIRGYADHSETIFEKDPFSYSMHLSSKRALAVFSLMREKGEIPAGIMVAHGFGMNLDGDGGSSKDSEMTRQVELIIDYSEEVPYHLKKPAKTKNFLDFDGFFFRTPGDFNEKK